MFSEWLRESNQTSENLPSCMISAACGRSLCFLAWDLVMLKLQPATGALVVSVCKNKLSLPRLQTEKRKVEVKCSLTRSGVAPHLCSASRPGKLRSGPASLEPTQRRRSASPCLIYWGHPAAKHKAAIHIHWIKDFLFNKQESCVSQSDISPLSLLSRNCYNTSVNHTVPF